MLYSRRCALVECFTSSSIKTETHPLILPYVREGEKKLPPCHVPRRPNRAGSTHIYHALPFPKPARNRTGSLLNVMALVVHHSDRRCPCLPLKTPSVHFMSKGFCVPPTSSANHAHGLRLHDVYAKNDMPSFDAEPPWKNAPRLPSGRNLSSLKC